MRYIDADAMLSKVKVNDDLIGKIDGKTLKAWIDSQPTVDVAPVTHAHWIKDDNGQSYCSACMDESHRPMFFVPHLQWEYCPWCGAKMDEVVE